MSTEPRYMRTMRRCIRDRVGRWADLETPTMQLIIGQLLQEDTRLSEFLDDALSEDDERRLADYVVAIMDGPPEHAYQLIGEIVGRGISARVHQICAEEYAELAAEMAREAARRSTDGDEP